LVWLHAPGRSAWAVLHTVRRHGGRVEDVVVIEVEVPRGWLRRNRRGLWFTGQDVPPGRFRAVLDFVQLSNRTQVA
jgi:hypothetical protein